MIASVAQEVLEWFSRKGITGDTVQVFDIRIADDGALVFPYGDHEKRRYGVPTGERRFIWEAGVDPLLFNRSEAGRRTLFLCEGETDTMRLRQELGDTPEVGVLGLPGIETWHKGMVPDFDGAEQIFVVLDNDTDYRVAGRVDLAWREIRASLGHRARRVYLPKSANDLCEFFQDHGLDALRLLVQRSARSRDSRFKTLDLMTNPEPPRWVVENMICQGDVHILIGEPNIGKSWITMAMALAVAEGRSDFLGHPIARNGRVLYLDAENPEDLVVDRFHKLGITDKGASNIRYISNVSVRLDKDPESFIDEAIDYDPVLVVLDSLTRIHGEDENASGPMSALFNNAINPLARDADAAVVLIHHVSKTDSSSSFKRARGSSDITASPDAGYDVYQSDDGTLRIKNFKARRAAQNETLYIAIHDTPEGGVELKTLAGFTGGVF